MFRDMGWRGPERMPQCICVNDDGGKCGGGAVGAQILGHFYFVHTKSRSNIRINLTSNVSFEASPYWCNERGNPLVAVHLANK